MTRSHPRPSRPVLPGGRGNPTSKARRAGGGVASLQRAPGAAFCSGAEAARARSLLTSRGAFHEVARLMPSAPVIHWPYFLGALLLLWFPRPWLRRGRWRRRRRPPREALEQFARDGASEPGDHSVKLRREFSSLRNHVDWMRGSAGAAALASFSFTASPAEASLAVTGLTLAVLLVGLLAQTLRRREGRMAFFAPIFYAVGLNLGLGNHYPALLAFLLVCAVNPVLPDARWFLTAYALALLPFNVLLGGGVQLAVPRSALLFVPIVLSLLAGRSLALVAPRPARW